MRRLLAVLLGGAALASQAAQPNTETFTAGSNGWSLAGGVVRSFSGGRASITFASLPIPETAYLVASNLAASGSYTGNYVGADIVIFGCDFIAEQTLPSDFSIRFTSPEGTLRRTILNTNYVVGTWTTVVASLSYDGATNSGWFTAGTNVFHNAISNITSFSIAITSIGPNTSFPNTVYRFDNIFIQTRPVVAALEATTNSVVLSGSSLQANVAFALESAETITSDWTTVSAFTATSGVSTVSSGTTNANFFRLKW